MAETDYPVHEFIARRWSPYAFDGRPVSQSDLRPLFEAARWATSSYNEQPWSYIVATKEDLEPFECLLSCLVETKRGRNGRRSLRWVIVSLKFAAMARTIGPRSTTWAWQPAISCSRRRQEASPCIR